MCIYTHIHISSSTKKGSFFFLNEHRQLITKPSCSFSKKARCYFGRWRVKSEENGNVEQAHFDVYWASLDYTV